VRDLSADRTKLLAKYKSICTPEAIADGDAARGRAVFEKTCASCHLLYGSGGKIGPDLTGSNRANLDYILLNSVDPSYDVPDGYKMVLIQTVDGRLLNGVIAEEDATRVVLKTVEQPEVVIAKDDIEARKVSTKSMMPDGQLDQMKPQEIIDLIKYLRTTEQVELQK
jgi:cytochrome c oxidase cbb3-type subunit I/II